MKKMSDRFITLKEAGELSGYSSDYIGQLIRKGKLPGQQVYSNVAWVTTPEAVLEYMEGSKRKTQRNSEDLLLRILRGAYMCALWLVIVIGGMFSLFLFYMTSVSIDARLQSAIQTEVEERIVTEFAQDTNERFVSFSSHILQ